MPLPDAQGRTGGKHLMENTKSINMSRLQNSERFGAAQDYPS